MGMIEKARNAAIIAHEGQKRRNGSPYFAHPDRVAGLVKVVPVNVPIYVVEAAYLHDVLKDTDYDISEIPKIRNLGSGLFLSS